MPPPGRLSVPSHECQDDREGEGPPSVVRVSMAVRAAARALGVAADELLGPGAALEPRADLRGVQALCAPRAVGGEVGEFDLAGHELVVDVAHHAVAALRRSESTRAWGAVRCGWADSLLPPGAGLIACGLDRFAIFIKYLLA